MKTVKISSPKPANVYRVFGNHTGNLVVKDFYEEEIFGKASKEKIDSNNAIELEEYFEKNRNAFRAILDLPL